MKSLKLFIIFGLLAHLALAQESPKLSIKAKNNLYLNNDIWANALNYDRIISQKGLRQIGIKAGLLVYYAHIRPLGINLLSKETFWGLGFTFGWFYLRSRPNLKNHWEYGLHVSFVKKEEPAGEVKGSATQITYNGLYHYDSYYMNLTPKIAFRHQNPNGGLFYKAGINIVSLGAIYTKDKVNPQNTGWNTGTGIAIWPDLGLGWSF